MEATLAEDVLLLLAYVIPLVTIFAFAGWAVEVHERWAPRRRWSRRP